MLENRKYYYLRSVKTTKLNEYSRKRKRPPKVQRLSGRLQEVVVYNKWTTGDLFREEVQAHLYYFMEDNLLQAMSKLGYV